MAELNTLAAQVLVAAFLLAAVFGAIAQRTHFCTMGAVSDALNMGDYSRLRQWALAAGVAILGFWGLVAAGQIDPLRTLHSLPRWLWLSGLVGGLLFGFGMVLGSGCGSKTLVRIGAGSLKSLVVALVLGLASYATLRGITAVLRTATVDRAAIEFPQVALLPLGVASISGMSLPVAGLVAALLVGGGLVAWALAGGREFRTFDNLLAGFGLGGVVVALWWVSGHLGFVPEHPETLEAVFLRTNSGRAESLSFVAPIAYSLDWVILFSDRGKVLTIGIVSVVGVIAGSAAVALASGRFRWEGFAGTSDLAHHLVGAVLMGVGGVTALGCTIGQGLTGLSTLSATSFTAVAGILAGAVLGNRYQVWRLEREG